jgi:hypothetical protein
VERHYHQRLIERGWRFLQRYTFPAAGRDPRVFVRECKRDWAVDALLYMAAVFDPSLGSDAWFEKALFNHVRKRWHDNLRGKRWKWEGRLENTDGWGRMAVPGPQEGVDAADFYAVALGRLTGRERQVFRQWLERVGAGTAVGPVPGLSAYRVRTLLRSAVRKLRGRYGDTR